jgi:hypothetical protein
VPEQHAQVRALIVGRHDKPAVHVGVPARLEAQQFPQLLRVRAVDGPHPPVRDADTRQRHRRFGHDPERLPSGVVIGR